MSQRESDAPGERRKLADRLDEFDFQDVDCSPRLLDELQGLMGLAAEALRSERGETLDALRYYADRSRWIVEADQKWSTINDGAPWEHAERALKNAAPQEQTAGNPASRDERTAINGVPVGVAPKVYVCPKCGTGLEEDPNAKHSSASVPCVVVAPQSLRELHDRLGAMIDQMGHPDYSLREMAIGLRDVRDQLFAFVSDAPTPKTTKGET